MAGIFRFVFEGDADGEDAQNSFWFHSADWDAADAADLIDAVVASFETNLAVSMHSEYSLSSVIEHHLSPITLAKFSVGIRFAITPIVGGGGGDGLPEGTCLLLNFRNGEDTLNRKRVFVGPWSESVSTDKKPTAPIIAQGQAFIDEVLAGFTVNTHTYLPVVVRLDAFQRYLGHELLTFGFVSHKWARLGSRRSR